MTIKPWTERTEFNGPCYPPEAQQEIDELRAKSEMDDAMLAGNTVLINELREKLAEQTEFAKNAAENYEAMHDELTSMLAEQKLIVFDYEMADYKGEVAMLKEKLAELELANSAMKVTP